MKSGDLNKKIKRLAGKISKIEKKQRIKKHNEKWRELKKKYRRS